MKLAGRVSTVPDSAAPTCRLDLASRKGHQVPQSELLGLGLETVARHAEQLSGLSKMTASVTERRGDHLAVDAISYFLKAPVGKQGRIGRHVNVKVIIALLGSPDKLRFGLHRFGLRRRR